MAAQLHTHRRQPRAFRIGAAFPIFVLLLLIGVFRKPSWIAALSGLGAAIVVALVEFGMPVAHMVPPSVTARPSVCFPSAGWCSPPSCSTTSRWKRESSRSCKKSVGNLTEDRRLQALLIAFAFGAFLEGAAGFGTPVAVAAAMMTGSGFSPSTPPRICLLANTAPVAFGSIGIPLTTLAGITSLPLDRLSAGVGRSAHPSPDRPAYLVMVMGGWKALRGVLPAAIVCGVGICRHAILVSNFIGPELADIVARWRPLFRW